MTVSFEMPDYCEGCTAMEIVHSKRKLYADGVQTETFDQFRCAHDKQCKHIFKHLLIHINNSSVSG